MFVIMVFCWASNNQPKLKKSTYFPPFPVRQIWQGTFLSIDTHLHPHIPFNSHMQCKNMYPQNSHSIQLGLLLLPINSPSLYDQPIKCPNPFAWMPHTDQHFFCPLGSFIIFSKCTRLYLCCVSYIDVITL
jgi:hypothetical protein